SHSASAGGGPGPRLVDWPDVAPRPWRVLATAPSPSVCPNVRRVILASSTSITPRGCAPRTPLQAHSRAASPARSVRLARFAALARVVSRPALARRTLGLLLRRLECFLDLLPNVFVVL